METLSALLALCAGNSPVTDDFPHKGQWFGALMFSLICAFTNGCVNNRDAGDLRRHCHDVTVMSLRKLPTAKLIQCGAVITRSILHRIIIKYTHSSPVRARYGVQFVICHYELYSASVNAMLYKISCNIEPRYNGTQLYLLQVTMTSWQYHIELTISLS